jgi:TonB family protein
MSGLPNISLQRTSSRRLAAAELGSFGGTGMLVAVVLLAIGGFGCASQNSGSAGLSCSGSRDCPEVHEANFVEPKLAQRVDATVRPQRRALVCLEGRVDAQGNVYDLKIIRSEGGAIDKSVIDAVKRWKYEPATQDGHPISACLNIAYFFPDYR